MSAIFGLSGRHAADSMQEMAERLRHRGHNVHIETVGDHLSVGAIDRNSRQSIYKSNGCLAVATGSIYALNGELDKSFLKSNIAELLKRVYDLSGAKSLAYVDGDYAAVLCDYNQKRIIFLRDFFGAKPLHWSVLSNDCLAFASEYKAIVALGEFRPSVDRSMIRHLQSTKQLPIGHTLFENVAVVQPGATVIASNRVIEHEPFEPLVCNVTVSDENTAMHLIDADFRKALSRRAGSDDPIGLALSGGIDSIAMAFHLRRIFPSKEIHTFTAGHGDDDPEMVTAAEIATQIDSIHHPVITAPDLMLTSLEKLVWHLEDPCARSEALQLMRIGEVASEYVDRMLSGQGADALFAGMPRHKLISLVGRLAPIRGALYEILDLTQMGLQPESILGKAFALALYRGKVPPVPEVINGGSIDRPKRFSPGPQFLNRVLVDGYQSSSVRSVAKFERTFGASGVDHTTPCFDLAFTRNAFSIDDHLKMKNGVQKYIFRKALVSVVPEKYRAIPKHPQKMHYDIAFADCLDQLAETFLSPSAVKSRGFFEPQSIARLYRRNSGRPYADEAAMRLWTAIATEMWARIFIDKRATGI